jgi:hypothetical protein
MSFDLGIFLVCQVVIAPVKIDKDITYLSFIGLEELTILLVKEYWTKKFKGDIWPPLYAYAPYGICYPILLNLFITQK